MQHTDAFHHSLALIDLLSDLVPRIYERDAALAHALRCAATVIPVALCERGREGLAHRLAARVAVLVAVAEAWGYVAGDAVSDAQRTAWHLHHLTALCGVAQGAA